VTKISDESLSELASSVMRRIDRKGTLLSNLVESLECSRINTEELSKTIQWLADHNLIKITHNFIVPPGANKDSIKGCSFQILLQKVVKLKDGTMGVDPVNMESTKRKQHITLDGTDVNNSRKVSGDSDAV